MGNYKWLVNIEPELWQCALDNDEKKLLLSKILKNCPLADMRMLHSDNVEKIILNDPGLFDLYLKIDPENNCTVIPRPEYLKTCPDVTSEIKDNAIKSDTLNQIGKISQVTFPPQCLYVTTQDCKQGRLSIQKDGNTIKDDVELVSASPNCLKEFADKAKPKFDQGDKSKHRQAEYYRGDMKVSSAQIYDPRNTIKAKVLLQKAFEDYVNIYIGDKENTTIPAKYLYAWDKEHNCFVKFISSNNNVYHVMDCPVEDVPVELKKLYGYKKEK